mmetsp:Transcript_86379/g.252784  ORF Transcript_86379/g.252784 Transcript_86379/m.252784 type:complete len:210 (+) Transcript_86379:294-923(+)
MQSVPIPLEDGPNFPDCPVLGLPICQSFLPVLGLGGSDRGAGRSSPFYRILPPPEQQHHAPGPQLWRGARAETDLLRPSRQVLQLGAQVIFSKRGIRVQLNGQHNARAERLHSTLAGAELLAKSCDGVQRHLNKLSASSRCLAVPGGTPPAAGALTMNHVVRPGRAPPHCRHPAEAALPLVWRLCQGQLQRPLSCQHLHFAGGQGRQDP